MIVPLLDLKAQMVEIRDSIDREIVEVMESCQFIMGPKVIAFENAIAAYCGVEFGIGVSSGTDALLIALMALDLGPGDLVITTPYSFFATAGAISRLGAQPVFVDIDPETYNIASAGIGAWFEDHPADAKRVKAIIPVHLYGQCADMEPIVAFAEERNIAVIEDAAQAIGSRYEGLRGVRSAGSMGDIGCFSFFPSKNLGGIGDGGMVVTSSSPLAEKLRKLRNHGSHPKYYHQLIGGNFRLDAIQAAVLTAKLGHLDAWHKARQANAEYYDKLFAGLNAVKTPTTAQNRAYHTYNQYVIRAQNRDGLRQHLADRDIATEIYYPVPFHLQDCFADLGYREGEMPQAELAAQTTLALPVYPELSRDMQEYVVDTIREFYG